AWYAPTLRRIPRNPPFSTRVARRWVPLRDHAGASRHSDLGGEDGIGALHARESGRARRVLHRRRQQRLLLRAHVGDDRRGWRCRTGSRHPAPRAHPTPPPPPPPLPIPPRP